MTLLQEGGKLPGVTIRDTFDDKGFPVKEVTIDLPEPKKGPLALIGLLFQAIKFPDKQSTARRFRALSAHHSPSHNGPQSGDEVTLKEARHIKGGA